MSKKEKNRENNQKKFDLKDRLIDYAIIFCLRKKAGKHISYQKPRSGTSPAPNYGEAQSAESKIYCIYPIR